MPFAEINNLKIYYELEGDAGEPIVLVHGSWGDSGGWNYLLPHLSANNLVLKYDRRGHSKSESPGGNGKISEDVDDLAALIELHDMSPVHIVGNSFGGNIALKLAGKRPEMISTIIIHDAPVVSLLKSNSNSEILRELEQKVAVVLDLIDNGEHKEGAELFMENIVFGPGSWEELPEESREKFVNNAVTFLDEQRDPQWMEIDKEALSEFTKPALLTYGENSEEFFRKITEKLHDLLPNSRKEPLKGMGHVPQLSHPQEYYEIITSFISDIK